MESANNSAELTTVEEAIAFLTSQGFQINPVDGVYRVRKEGWERRPYEVSAEVLISQADLARRKALAEDTFTRIGRSNADTR